MNRNIEIYRSFLNGKSVEDLGKEYKVSEFTIKNAISNGMYQENNYTEWMKQFESNTAMLLARSEIYSEEDLYDMVKSGNMVARGFGKKKVEDLNKYIPIPLDIEYTNHGGFMRPTLVLKKKHEKKPIKICGTFRGYLNGIYTEGEIKGEYESERRNSEVHAE